MAFTKLCFLVFLALKSTTARSLSDSSGCLESMWKCVSGSNQLSNYEIDPNSQLSDFQQHHAQYCAFTLNEMLPCYEEFARRCLTNGSNHFYYHGYTEMTKDYCTDPNTLSDAEIMQRCGKQMAEDPQAFSEITSCSQEASNAVIGSEFFAIFSLLTPNAAGSASTANWETISQTIDSPAMKSYICCDTFRVAHCGLDHILRICGQEAYDIQLNNIAKQQRGYKCTDAELASCHK